MKKMHPARKQRLLFILGLVLASAIAVSLALFALQQNINLFYSPTQVLAGKAPRNHIFRLGGLVVPGTIHHAPHGLRVSFALTDKKNQVTVYYRGILPTLFRAGQGIVVQGKFNAQGEFAADQVLAKHDANYMPPEVAAELKKAN